MSRASSFDSTAQALLAAPPCQQGLLMESRGADGSSPPPHSLGEGERTIISAISRQLFQQQSNRYQEVGIFLLGSEVLTSTARIFAHTPQGRQMFGAQNRNGIVMFFKSLVLHHFGSYDRFEAAFEAGINVITGDNATGKTQLIGALFSALIGKPAIRVNSEGIGPSTVRVLIDEDGVVETLTLNVSIDHRGVPQISRTSSIDGPISLVSPSTRLLSMLSNPDGPQLLLHRDTEPRALTSSDLNSIDHLLPEELRQSPYWSCVRERGTAYDATSSGGERTVSRLIAEFYVRKRADQHLPLIVDEFFQLLPNSLSTFSLALLEQLAQTTQVIVVTNNRASLHTQHVIAPPP